MSTSLPPVVQQLHMVWPLAQPDGPAPRPIPAGYSLRTFRDGDAPAYIRLMQRSGFGNWDETKAQGVFDTMYSQALFFVVHDGSGALASTAVAQNKPDPWHPGGGEMGWVATDPDQRGKGLSYAPVALATRRLLAEGHPSVFLKTDDGRLPAIRVYLNLGFVPFLYLPDMEERWRVVCSALGMDYAASGATTDPAGRDNAGSA